jgi:hypothetical protein
MKVLFVGEGPHDIGSPEFAPRPSQAVGVIPILARKVSPEIGADSVGLFWREIPVLNRDKRKKGFAAKVANAILLAVRNKCEGTVCVADQDAEVVRLAAMEEGAERGLAIVGNQHRAVCGVAVESVEAWTLGAPSAIATILKDTKERVLQEYKLAAVEEFNQNSGKLDQRPKDLLERIAGLKHGKASAEWREDIANATDPAELCQSCHQGFKPFTEKLKAAFGPRPT